MIKQWYSFYSSTREIKAIDFSVNFSAYNSYTVSATVWGNSSTNLQYQDSGVTKLKDSFSYYANNGTTYDITLIGY